MDIEKGEGTATGDEALSQKNVWNYNNWAEE